MKIRCYCDIADGVPPHLSSVCVIVEKNAKDGGYYNPPFEGNTRYWFTIDIPVAEAKEKDLGVVEAEAER